MGAERLTPKEKKFVIYQSRWNGKFESIFSALIIISLLVPFVIMIKLNIPGIDKIYAGSRDYIFFLVLGWLVTFLNERWSRIVRKLLE